MSVQLKCLMMICNRTLPSFLASCLLISSAYATVISHSLTCTAYCCPPPCIICFLIASMLYVLTLLPGPCCLSPHFTLHTIWLRAVPYIPNHSNVDCCLLLLLPWQLLLQLRSIKTNVLFKCSNVDQPRGAKPKHH
jgi:hypothetical protein